MELYFKHPGKLRGEYTKTENKLFAICHYQPGPAIQGMCWEYDIIQKINRNEEGYFDFSKNLIDIGSEDGGYAIYCNFNKNYCFEPNRQMCCLIWTNMYLHDKVHNTEVYNVFLSDNSKDTIKFDGFASEKVNEYCTSPFGTTGGNRNNNEVIEINQHLLDEYNIQNVGLIKVDTEGYDYFVLKGGIETIKNNNYPPILFENWRIGDYGWSKENHDRLNDFIKKMGYTIIEYWGAHDTHLAIKL